MATELGEIGDLGEHDGRRPVDRLGREGRTEIEQIRADEEHRDDHGDHGASAEDEKLPAGSDPVEHDRYNVLAHDSMPRSGRFTRCGDR